jgi:predicted Zn-dependent protease
MNPHLRRLTPLAIILAAGIAAIVAAEWQHITARPSPQAMLTAAADAQHEVTRVPAHFDVMSDADEIRIGDQLAANYAETFARDNPTAAQRAADKQTEAYLQTIGLRVAAHARRKLPWRFHYIPSEDFINAFALPGGHVFVGEGLLRLMHSEDALAGVLGHEVTHVDLRHCAERVQLEAHERNLGLLGALASIPISVFTAGYSKEQELEADRDGTTLAVRTGYSPLGILQLFDEFAKLESRYASPQPATPDPLDETLHLSLATLSGYFASHPPAAERIQQVRALMAANHWPTPPLRPLLTRPPRH